MIRFLLTLSKAPLRLKVKKLNRAMRSLWERRFSQDVQTNGAHFLYVSGEPLNEPVTWRGPIVMNTEEELAIAFEELDDGTFIKSHKPTKLTL